MAGQNPNALFVGVDLGGTTVKVALVDHEGRILTQKRAATEGNGATSLLDQITTLVREAADSPEAGGRVQAVGIGLPGLVNTKLGEIEVLPNIPGVDTRSFLPELKSRLGLPVAVDNDANLAGYAEHQCGAGVGHTNMLFVGLGTGVGSGLVINNRIYRGSTGFAGEFGHMTVDPEGLECVCGNQGCIETIASAPNIVRRARARLFHDSTSSLSKLGLTPGGKFTSEDVANAAAEGDELAQLILERTGTFLGIALASAINLLNVDMVVLGGGVMAAGDLILRPAVDEVRRRAFKPSFRECMFALAKLGADAGMIGAALVGRDEAE